MVGGIKWYFMSCVKILLIVIVYIAVMALLVDVEINNIIFPMAPLAYGIFSFSVSVSLYKIHVPLAISMGITRKNAFIGTCFFNAFNAVFGLGLTAVLGILSGQKENMIFWCVWTVIVIFITNAFGLLCGILYKRFGRIAAVVSGLVMYIVFMIVLIFTDWRSDDLQPGSKAQMLFYMGAAVMVVWCAVMAAHYKTVKKLAV